MHASRSPAARLKEKALHTTHNVNLPPPTPLSQASKVHCRFGGESRRNNKLNHIYMVG
ncbi:hypothetical protein QVD99_000859 [Batrachochytrium dendrobatidis]|nr:hypothetical protein O5D80_003708 [Batrachochytrium dendrobatidis]KAK5673410.1 hypothetical protein QVD99_000859 [Batrachochytrium dendrobatidis]